VGWPRSLYWRIATGIVALIAIVLFVQAAALLWLVRRGDPGAERLSMMTRAMGRELGEALTADPNLDVAGFLRDRSPTAPFFTARTNGRVDGVHPSDSLAGSVLEDVRNLPVAPVTWAVSEYHAAPIVVNGKFDGVVALVPRTPFQRYGPGVGAVVISVMLLGTVLATALIVGPVRQRLHDLTRVARQLGAGDFTARAKQDGADEVTELAAAFNLTADELGARTTRLEASDAARRQLLADVSHELMTPVTTIRGYLETLAMPEVQLDLATRTRYVAVARRETGRLERLIGDLLSTWRGSRPAVSSWRSPTCPSATSSREWSGAMRTSAAHATSS
jgi:signal transduction histidine kinase